MKLVFVYSKSLQVDMTDAIDKGFQDHVEEAFFNLEFCFTRSV